jgi:hypothetical protein
MSTMEGSTAPFDDGAPEQGVDLQCDNGHSQRIYLRGMTAEMANDYAGILDGTSPMYVTDPRVARQETFIGHCQRPNCGALFRATPFGFRNN